MLSPGRDPPGSATVQKTSALHSVRERFPSDGPQLHASSHGLHRAAPPLSAARPGFSLHHPGMWIIGFRKTLLIAFLVTGDSVVILSILSTRQSRLTPDEALVQALESFQRRD